VSLSLWSCHVTFVLVETDPTRQIPHVEKWRKLVTDASGVLALLKGKRRAL
jgi:hypothetical protein